jgi:glucan phosphoethanolaminetransferase (alkaline phosphatase superfamily)
MRPALRRSSIMLLLTYLLLSGLPFLPWVFGRPVMHAAQLAAGCLVAWLAVWSLLGRPARFHWLLLPAFLALPVELYLQFYFGQGISTHHLGVIAETSPKEAMEFLGRKTWVLGTVLALDVAWFIGSWRLAWHDRQLHWTGPSRWATLVLLAAGAALWLAGGGLTSSSFPPGKSMASKTVSRSPTWAQVPVDAAVFARTWPFGVVMHAHAFWKERRYLAELARQNRDFRFGARQEQHADDPQIIVMVLGESSRADRWSLNGYGRDTNPLLKQESNLVSLSDVVTPVSATRLSVPVIMSRKTATQSLKAGFAEKSFLSAYREAGFKTFWLSNQMSFGEFDTPVSVFAKEADVTQFVNLGGFTNRSSHDDVLLGPLEAAMRDPAPKKLIVLHTLGNHWNYSQRHPAEFDRWKPSLYGIDKPAYTNLKLKAEINNSYDNSILYTDWFLDQVIGALKAETGLGAMMYVADHGQTLYDGACRLAFHGHNTQYEFHVPALVWYSDSYEAAYPDKIGQLRAHRRAPLSTENIFHSLLDMASIRYPGEQLERSLFSARLSRHTRYVDSYGWTDYDSATFRGDCREVIAKGKPLPRD